MKIEEERVNLRAVEGVRRWENSIIKREERVTQSQEGEDRQHVLVKLPAFLHPVPRRSGAKL